jgi:cytochrome c-type biogenesis protein CcmF
MPIKDFTVAYLKDTIERQTRTFSVQFNRRDANGNPVGEQFVLKPNVMYDRQFSKIVASNPSTQHYWNYDIFTHVSSLPKAELDPEFAKEQEDSLRWQKYEAVIGDTIFTQKHFVIVDGVTKTPEHPEYKPEKGDLSYGLKLRARSLEDSNAYAANPMLYLRVGQGGFTLPATVGQLQMKIRLTEESMTRIFQSEEQLKYTSFNVKEASVFDYQGYKIRFTGAEKEVKHPAYVPEPNDIAVGAGLEITAPDGRKATAAPVYLIRDNRPFSLKDEAPEFGLHFKFDNIDPKAGLLTISVAKMDDDARKIPVEIAENAPRSDYIVLEAIIFPGINLVWIGSITMLFGLVIAFWRRMSGKG